MKTLQNIEIWGRLFSVEILIEEILSDFISEKEQILNLTYTMNLPRIPYQDYLRTKMSIFMVENLLRPVFHTILGLPMVESMVIVQVK